MTPRPDSASLADAVAWQALTSPARLPGLSPAGEAMLRRLHDHPAAPIFRDFSGHRLSKADQRQARVSQAWLRHAPTQRHAGDGRPPAWLWAWLWRHQASVVDWPSSRDWLHGWTALRTTSRADLQARLAELVPLERQGPGLLCFTTSGTTGHPIRVPSTPLATAAYQPLHERALALHGVRLAAGRGDVGIVLVGCQRRCFTYVSVNPLRGECGLVKLNLVEDEWRHPDDRAAYLDDLAPELVSGDPVSLGELAKLPLRHRPRALLSTSMSLGDGLRRRLARRFGCPVVDLYSMNEAGPIAAWLDDAQGHVLLQPGMYVEILDAQGRPLPAGEFGEITLTGGINPCLPLLRYRTGDHARLVLTPWGAALRDLQGRAPVRFRTAQGGWVNNVDITRALKRFDLQRFALHQRVGGTLQLRASAGMTPLDALHAALREALAGVLGPLPLDIEPLLADDKVRQYTSDLEA